ncbi:MAG: glycosyltransferase family 2 protein [Candidatus Aenigmarchaeota archaeon]|nr:glycosyltransferase family 2 protein [Candidatus Aenigmarchaeota archaeon]
MSIIIPSYNKAGVIEKTINSVLSLDYPSKEIIVVNDGSTDNTLDICKKFVKSRKIKLISYSKNRGKAYALNMGIRAAKNDIVVTVDADSFPESGSLNKLVCYFADPKVGAVAGTVKVSNKKKFLVAYQGLEYLHQAFQRICQGFLNTVMVAPGPLTAYRKEALAKAGYFENDTLVEDFDMTIKIHKAGYKVVSEKKAVVFTEAPKTIKELWRQRVRWSRGGVQIAKKHFDIFSNKNTKRLAFFAFPLHMLWLVLPFILVPTFLITTAKSAYALIQSILFGLSQIDLSRVSFSFDINSMGIYLFFVSLQQGIIDFLSLNNLNLLLMLGYISVSIFLIFTGFSFRVLKEKFKPKDLQALVSIALYWILLAIVGIYSILLEITNRRRKW